MDNTKGRLRYTERDEKVKCLNNKSPKRIENREKTTFEKNNS